MIRAEGVGSRATSPSRGNFAGRRKKCTKIGPALGGMRYFNSQFKRKNLEAAVSLGAWRKHYSLAL